MKDIVLNDKLLERARYDERAMAQLTKERVGCESANTSIVTDQIGASAVPLPLRAPYIYFERQLEKYLSPECAVLEIGCGFGGYTGNLIASGAQVTAIDISEHSLAVLQKRYKFTDRLQTFIGDMEHLSLDSGAFDVVVSAGSLSYGDNRLVLSEIHRLLKPGGVLICVDSLNHNIVYRFNRWLHFRRGDRTLSTLHRMPRLETIDLYRRRFSSVEVKFFGSVSWLMPVLRRLIGDSFSARVSDLADEWLRVKRSAFKFVLVARKANDDGLR